MSRIMLQKMIFGSVMFFLAVFPQISFSSHYSESAALKYFDGGSLDGLFSFRSSLLSGPGVNASLYGMTAPNEAGPLNVFGNPAVLGRIAGTKLAFSLSPPMELDIESLTDLDANLEEQLEAGFETFRQIPGIGDVKPTPGTDGSGVLRKDGAVIGGIAASFTLADSDSKLFGIFPKLFDRIAIGYHQPFFMNIAADWSGLRMRIRTIASNHEVAEEMILYISIKMSTELLITADSWAVAAARQRGNFWFGAGLSRTDIGISVAGHQKTDGILSRRSNEKAFNDPDDPWDNDYFNSANVQIDGTSVGLRLGVTHQVSERFYWGADLQLQSKAEMEGPLEFEVHTFQALNLNADAEKDEKSFDINKIDITELTKTHSKLFEPSPITIRIPSSLTFGFAYERYWLPNFTFKKYFGELSYSLMMLEDGAEFNYKRGLKPDWNALLGFKFGKVKFGIGAIKMVDMNEGYHDKNGDKISVRDPFYLPRLSMGFDTRIGENVTLELLGLALPEDLLRLTIKFDL